MLWIVIGLLVSLNILVGVLLKKFYKTEKEVIPLVEAKQVSGGITFSNVTLAPTTGIEIEQEINGTWCHHSFRPEGHSDLLNIRLGHHPTLRVKNGK